MDNKNIPEDSSFPILTHDGGETFELDLEQEIRLLSAIGEADRGELISASDLLERIRH